MDLLFENCKTRAEVITCYFQNLSKFEPYQKFLDRQLKIELSKFDGKEK